MTNRLRLVHSRRRPEVFDDDAPNYLIDLRAMLRDWDFLRAPYEHLPEFKELVHRYLDER